MEIYLWGMGDSMINFLLGILTSLIASFLFVVFTDTKNIWLRNILNRYLLFNKKGRALESFRLVHKDSNHSKIILNKSSVKNAIGFIRFSNTSDIEEVIIERFAFTNTFTNGLFFIGHNLLKNTTEWNNQIQQNSSRFQYNTVGISPDSYRGRICKKVLKVNPELKVIRLDLSTHLNYHSQTIVFARGIGIVYSKLDFKNRDFIEYKLKKWKITDGSGFWLPVNRVDNYWRYEIITTSSPNSLSIR